MPDAPGGLAVLDEPRIAELEQHIGAGRTRALAQLLMVQICQVGDRVAAQLAAGRSADARRELHALVSTSGSLGAARLSALCRTLLDRTRRGDKVEPALVEEFAQAVGDTERAFCRRYGPART